MDKKEIRKAIKEIELPEDYYEAASDSIAKKILSSDEFIKAKTLFIYVSTKREPDTTKIIEEAFKRNKTVCVPKCGKKPDMDAVVIKSFADLSEGAYGLFEPKDGTKVPKNEIDFAVIPCVSATKDGVRLGHGGGFYDKFLSTYGGQTVCLCFGKLLGNNLPEEEHDIKVKVISEELC